MKAITKTLPLILAFALSFLAVGKVGAHPAGQYTYPEWIGPASGMGGWFDAANWNMGYEGDDTPTCYNFGDIAEFVRFGYGALVSIANSGTAVLESGTAWITGLEIKNNSALEVAASGTLWLRSNSFIGTVNAGSLTISGEVRSQGIYIGYGQAEENGTPVYYPDASGTLILKDSGVLAGGLGSYGTNGYWGAGSIMVGGYDGNTGLMVMKDNSLLRDMGVEIACGPEGSGTMLISNHAVADTSIRVGNGGLGVLEVSGDGWIKRSLTVGCNEENGSGTVVFRDRARLDGDGNWGDLVVGANGLGVMTMKDNSSAQVWLLRVGYDSEEYANGTLTLENNASLIIKNADWEENRIGGNGKGLVILKDDSRVTSDNIRLGHESSGEGTVQIGGAAVWSVVDMDTENVNDDGEATFIVGHEGTGLLRVMEDGRLNVDGALLVNDISTVEFGLSSGRTAGAFIATGDASLDGTLGILALDAGAIAIGDSLTFLLIDSATALDSRFASIQVDDAVIDAGNIADLGEDRYGFAFGSYEYLLNYAAGLDGKDVTLTVAAVPEPGTWAMMAGGLGMLALLRRRGGGRVRA